MKYKYFKRLSKESKTMDYEQFKERIEEDLHQALADHGIDISYD